VNADPKGDGKLRLRETDEGAQRHDVRAVFEFSIHETLANSGRDCPRKVFFSELGDVSHGLPQE
jgi:hypothetical protein